MQVGVCRYSSRTRIMRIFTLLVRYPSGDSLCFRTSSNTLNTRLFYNYYGRQLLLLLSSEFRLFSTELLCKRHHLIVPMLFLVTSEQRRNSLYFMPRTKRFDCFTTLKVYRNDKSTFCVRGIDTFVTQSKLNSVTFRSTEMQPTRFLKCKTPQNPF